MSVESKEACYQSKWSNKAMSKGIEVGALCLIYCSSNFKIKLDCWNWSEFGLARSGNFPCSSREEIRSKAV
jgi:hypothetical protein